MSALRIGLGEDCDAMFIAGSQLPTHCIVAGLQREFGRPVWSSIQASAWQVKEELCEEL